MGKEKVKINSVVIGHVDSGKSTTIGHLVCDLGVVDKHVNETTDYQFTAIDAPGHPDFFRNMITGAWHADCALLIVDSTTGILMDGQTGEHALLAYTLGVEHIICCCNKMDATTPKYSEETYDEILKSVSLCLKKVGYDADKIRFVPISGLEGDNLIERSSNLDWYKGPTLREALDQIQEPNRHSDKPLRLPIQDVKIHGTGTVAVGRVVTGILKPGMKVTVGPIGHTAKVGFVEMHHEAVQEALPGDGVSFHLKKLDARHLQRGYVASDSKNDPAKEAASFISLVCFTNYPGGRIFNGCTAIVDGKTFHGAVKFDKILSKIDWRSGKELEKDPYFLKNGDAGIVKMVPIKPMVVETFADYPPIGRFTIGEKGAIAGVGIIKNVEKKEYPYGGAKGRKSTVLKRGKRLGAAVAHALIVGGFQIVVAALGIN